MSESDEAVRTAPDGQSDSCPQMNLVQHQGINARCLPYGLLPGSPQTNGDTLRNSVAVIDSHSLTRECIANSIDNSFADTTVLSFLSVYDFNTPRQTHFNLIILYLHGPDYHPLELIRSLAAPHSDSVIFLISDLDYHTNPEFIRAAWRLGARGFISTKATSMTLALSAIRFVQAGGFFAPIDALLSRSSIQPETRPITEVPAELTARENVVLSLLKEGKTNKLIARQLQLSSNTVKVHVHNILRKMRARNRTEAASRDMPAGVMATGGSLMLS
jgi:DNA-binding NarL/FixJ family response regulator